jgi:hypothetical protein
VTLTRSLLRVVSLLVSGQLPSSRQSSQNRSPAFYAKFMREQCLETGIGFVEVLRNYAAAVVTAPFRNVSRSALIVSASVVGIPWGKPL